MHAYYNNSSYYNIKRLHLYNNQISCYIFKTKKSLIKHMWACMPAHAHVRVHAHTHTHRITSLKFKAWYLHLAINDYQIYRKHIFNPPCIKPIWNVTYFIVGYKININKLYHTTAINIYTYVTYNSFCMDCRLHTINL